MRPVVFPVVILLVAGVVWLLVRPEHYDVVLYCAVDPDQSRPIAMAYEERAGIRVRYESEVETLRSVGLSRRLLEEKDEPVADVFWNNEIMTTVYLGQKGILDPLPPGVADGFPPEWRDPEGRYVAFGARARILLVSRTHLPDPKDWPDSVEDLLDPKYAKMGLQTCMAVPETGTTFTHAVALLVASPEKAKAFFQAIQDASVAEDAPVRLVKGNGPAADQVRDASNKVAFALTDTDDAWARIQEGANVEVVYPDQGPGQPGTLLIPNTVALVKGRPHPGTVSADLLRWLVSGDTEATLAKGPSAQIPLRPGVEAPDRILRPGKDFRAMAVDWQEVGRHRDTWWAWLQRVFHAAR
jgi:iron(III) transport system substrate-binding protein